MTSLRSFPSAAEASSFLDSLGGWQDPPAVVPLKGLAAHEVAVGPVHAGVIEPGHFRFQCMGEDVYNLQIFLGYQHRGVEAAIAQAHPSIPRQLALAETCAGDTSAAAATAFSALMETAFPSRFPAPSPETARIRSVLLELERIANHVGDLGALAGDVAFLQSAAFCGRIRGDFLNLTALLCGNRFGRHAIAPGSSPVSLSPDKSQTILSRIATLKPELDRALDLMFDSPSVNERFENTGVVLKSTADAIGLLGPAGRASREFAGDVKSRALVRRLEIDSSVSQIVSLLSNPPPPAPTPSAPAPAPSSHFTVVSTVNAWRGSLVHAASFDPPGKMLQYKIVDPSSVNWHGLAWALRREQISNFPICNKSFNLSYCGTDR